MASTQTWSEFNGVGSTETGSRTDVNWKNIDDSTSAYTAYPITAGNNSYGKYQALKFGGSWNTLSSFTYKIDNNAPATGQSIVGAVVTSYTQPATTATGDGSMSTSGASANFVSSSSAFGTGTSTASGGGTMYAQALRTQLQTTTSSAPGDTGTRTITAAWTES